MEGFWGTVGLILLIAFLMVSCEPQATGERVRTFIEAVQGE